MARTRQKAKGRAEHSGGFIAIPHALHDHPAFGRLSQTAFKVLLGLIRQYRGKNNGDLSASFTQAEKWGVGSKTSLANALTELQEVGFIFRTREGVFTNPGGRCALYALAWKRIDECPGKELAVMPSTTPRLKLSMEKIKTPGTACVPG